MAAPLATPRPAAGAREHLRRERLGLHDGARTTVYVARYDPRRPSARRGLRARSAGHAAPPAESTRRWSAASSSGPDGGRSARCARAASRARHVPFDAPWDGVRACVHVDGGARAIARARRASRRRRAATCSRPARCWCRRRGAFAPTATPRASAPARASSTPTSPTAAIRAPRWPAPRPAARRRLRRPRRARRRPDARRAGRRCWPRSARATRINLDGGGSTSLVCGGRLRNRPRAEHGVRLPGGRPISTALVFSPRARGRPPLA